MPLVPEDFKTKGDAIRNDPEVKHTSRHTLLHYLQDPDMAASAG